jgi:hypothetical protein
VNKATGTRSLSAAATSARNVFKKLLPRQPAPTQRPFAGSKSYWENRYAEGGTSGAGSYGRLAEFKANVLNGFIGDNDIESVIEWGCGDGNQLSLVSYPSYVGVDVSPTAIDVCTKKFGADRSKTFYTYDEATVLTATTKYDLSLSLDVIFHLTEDHAFNEYMKNLFSSSDRFVIIYSSDSDTLTDEAQHVRHRQFSKWVELYLGNTWSLRRTIQNPYPLDMNDPSGTSFSDFYIFSKT